MDNEKKKVSQWLLWGLIALVIAIIIISWIGIDCFIDDNNNRGTFGDKFGSVNALFSGLAFAGLIYTIVLQRKDLQIQNEDLELTRNELRAQKEEAQKQNATLLKQEFNTMYFNFLATNRNIIDVIQGKSRTGQQYIKYIYTLLLGKHAPNYHSFSRDDYMSIYEEHRENLSYYFKSIHNLFHFINNSRQIDSSEKSIYFSMLMSQLSDYEIILLFYDNIYRNSDELIKTLIEHYSLFYKFPDDLLIKETDKSLYDKPAYGV